MRRPRIRENRLSRTIRHIGVGLLGTASWLAVVASAITLFAASSLPGGPFHGSFYGYEELIGFAAAFAVSGSVGGLAVIAAFGDRRWAIVMGLLLASAAGAIACLAAWVYPAVAVRAYGYSPLVAATFRRKLVECLLVGSALGVAAGIALSIVVVIARLLLRRGGAWRLGLALVPVLVATTVSLLPPTAFRLVELGHRLGLVYGGGDARAIIGASAGSVTGALSGGIVALLVARCFGGGQRGQARRAGS